MNLIDGKQRVVLILSHFWTPINITTAKEGLKKLIACGCNSLEYPSVKVLSNGGEPLLWEEWIDPERAYYYKEQPFIQSSKKIYPVPTILLTTSKWVYQTKEKPDLRYLYDRYKGHCQICGEKKTIKDMSIEHIYPKSKGGTKDGFNVTITCHSCNCKKAALYPYKNHKGEELKPCTPWHFFHAFQKERKEWRPFLFRN